MPMPDIKVAETVVLRAGEGLYAPTAPIQYIVAANAIFKRSANPYIDATALVQSFDTPLPGLATLFPFVQLRVPRFPQAWLDVALSLSGQYFPNEVLLQIVSTVGKARLTMPEQRQSVALVETIQAPDAAVDVICDIHSHHIMPTEFSPVDDRDEQSLRFYGVLGWSSGVPTMRLRVGVYGAFVNVPLTTLFDGCGPFEDLNHD